MEAGFLQMDKEPIANQDAQSVQSNPGLGAAKALYWSGDEAGAVPLFRALAEAGSAPAMTWVGYVYMKGTGVAVDNATALEWFLKAAEAGDSEAMGWLGYIYFFGRGVPADSQLAREWYLKGAQAGDAYAMYQLGQSYFHGTGVDVDMATAYDWYAKGSEAGDAAAMSSLGYMYSHGMGVPVDLDAARLWYSRSAEEGDPTGQHNYASVFFTAGESEEAARWMRKSAAQGHEPAIKWVRQDDAHNLMTAKRYAEALPALEQLAGDGDAWAHEWLGYSCLYGRGVAKNPGQAAKHYEAAFEGGRHAVARYAGIANFRANAPEVALEWLRKVTSTPTSSLYWQFRVLDVNSRLERYAGECNDLLVKAADAGHLYAHRALAMRMIKGQRNFGTRLQGLRMFLGVLPQVKRIVENNLEDDLLY